MMDVNSLWNIAVAVLCETSLRSEYEVVSIFRFFRCAAVVQPLLLLLLFGEIEGSGYAVWGIYCISLLHFLCLLGMSMPMIATQGLSYNANQNLVGRTTWSGATWFHTRPCFRGPLRFDHERATEVLAREWEIISQRET